MQPLFTQKNTLTYEISVQNGIILAPNVLDDLEVIEIWNPNKSLADKSFPGYKNVCIGYKELKKKIQGFQTIPMIVKDIISCENW